MEVQSIQGVTYGPSARNAFESYKQKFGDTHIDFENLSPLTNLTSQIPGLTFRTTLDRSFQIDNPINTGVNVVCSPTVHFDKTCSPENHQIMGVRSGNISDGQSLYEISFSKSQRRVGIERNWNTYSLTHFYNGDTLLATHRNTCNNEFVGYVADSALITRIVLDGIASKDPKYPRGIYQVGNSDDLFFGDKSDDQCCSHCCCHPCHCHHD